MNRGRHKKSNKSFLYKFIKSDIINKMLNYQQEQTGKKDITIFELNPTASSFGNGFDWDETTEGIEYWSEILYELKYHNDEFRIEEKKWCKRFH